MSLKATCLWDWLRVAEAANMCCSALGGMAALPPALRLNLGHKGRL